MSDTGNYSRPAKSGEGSLFASSSFSDRGDGYCGHCGRLIGWHAGYSCYPPTATGMPSGLVKYEVAVVDRGREFTFEVEAAGVKLARQEARRFFGNGAKIVAVKEAA